MKEIRFSIGKYSMIFSLNKSNKRIRTLGQVVKYLTIRALLASNDTLFWVNSPMGPYEF